MSRSLKKGPFIDPKLAKKAAALGSDDRTIIKEEDIERFLAVSDAHIQFHPDFEKKADQFGALRPV